MITESATPVARTETEIEILPGIVARVSARNNQNKLMQLILENDGYAGMHNHNDTQGYHLELSFSGDYSRDDNPAFFFSKKKDGTIDVLRGKTFEKEILFQRTAQQQRGGGSKTFLDPATNHLYACIARTDFGVITVCVALLIRDGETICVLKNLTYQSFPHLRIKEGGGRSVRFPELELVEHGGLKSLADELRMRKIWDPRDQKLGLPLLEEWSPQILDTEKLKEGQILISLPSIRQDQYTGIRWDGQAITIRGKSLGRSGGLERGQVVEVQHTHPNNNTRSSVPFFGAGWVKVIPQK